MCLKLNSSHCAMALKVIALMLLCATTSRLGSVVADDTHTENIRKCCPAHQVWNIEQNRCETLPYSNEAKLPLETLIPWLEEVEYKVTIGHECPEGTTLHFLNPRNPLQDYSESEYGLVLTQGDVVLPTDQFCFDRRDLSHQVIAMACVASDWPGLSVAPPKIPVNKCCSKGQSYVPATKTHPNSGCRTTNQTWRPPQIQNEMKQILPVFPDDWDISHGVPTCADGEDLVTYYLPEGNSETREVVLTQNGDLHDRKLPVVHNPGQFCVDDAVVDSAARSVVQVCFHDPCKNKTCIRRCCPEGYVMNLTTKGCDVQTSPPFHIEVKDAHGHLLPNRSESQIHYFYSVMPDCSATAINNLNPKDNPADYFYIGETGNLFVPAYKKRDREIPEYCVDNFGEEPNSLHVNALICFPEENEDPEDVQAVIKIYPYFLFFSSIFLLATFVVYAILPELQNLHGMTIMCHVFSLFVTYVCLGVIQLHGSSFTVCRPIAVVIHFFFLSAFAWMGTMGFDLFWTFSGMRVRRAGQERHVLRFVKYSLFAWGMPLVIVAIGQILDNLDDLPDWVVQPEFGKEKCWFSDSDGQLGILCYFYIPIAVVLVCNLTFFVTTAVRLYRANRDSNMATRNSRAKQRFRVVLSVSVLMGVTWIMELVSWSIGGTAYYWMATDILNILQGVLIFVIFVCKRKVLQLLYRRYQPLIKAWRAVVPECMACYCCDKYATRDTSTIRVTTSSTKRKISNAHTSQSQVRESSVEREPVSSSVVMNDMHSKR